jgi:uncharacterized membrane protein
VTPERAVSRVLLLGGFLAVTLMIGGLAALELRALRTAHPLDIAHVVENREAGRSVDVFVSVPQLARALARWPPSPLAVIVLGIVVLLATPAVGVVAALIAFARERDRRFLAICVALLVGLVAGFLLNVGG